jgi:transcriptional regulator with XRE-family HTH domain
MSKALAAAAAAALLAASLLSLRHCLASWQLSATGRGHLMIRLAAPRPGAPESGWEDELDLEARWALPDIAHCDKTISGCCMRLGEKLRYLREVEGTLRGLGRELTQQEVVRLLKREAGKAISQSYLSQIESGARPHLTNSTRMLLAKFFKVHPGYLVDDPEGYHEELRSDAAAAENRLDLWLINGAENFRNDPELCEALLTLARHDDSRMCLVLLQAILDNPGLAERLLHVLKPGAGRRQP